MWRFNMTTEEVKAEIEKYMEQHIDVEPEEMISSRWVNNIYGVDPQYAVGGYDWDEDEEYSIKCNRMADMIEEDGLVQYVDVEDDEFELQDEIIDWLRRQ